VGGQRGGGSELVEPESEAGEDVSIGLGEGCDGKLDSGVVQTCVGGEAARAGDVAKASEVVCLTAGEDGGAGETVTDDGVGEGELGDFCQVLGESCELCGVGQRL